LPVHARVLVTGAAGFIGSHLAKRLARNSKVRVLGIDSLEGNYPHRVKLTNIKHLRQKRNFSFLKANLREIDLYAFLRETGHEFDFIFHQAATPGVRDSWDKRFEESYVPNNILATKLLLEAAVGLPSLKRFIYASSSSVYGAYGNRRGEAFREDGPCQPLSNYGNTKLSAENLCFTYFHEHGIPAVSLRYFTVYGPAQRPDMGFHRLIAAALTGEKVNVHKGDHTRDFTFVGDIIEANLLAMRTTAGEVFNIGGGSVISLSEVIRILEEITGKTLNINWVENPKGNVLRTHADLTKSRRVLGYNPQTGIRQGLKEQVASVSSRRKLYGF
jgi:nucleoside-diphosphate-sugar epimerase